MKKGEKRKQQKALQQRAARQAARPSEPASALQYVRHAREYPIEGCWTFENWRELGITDVVVARRQPNGNIVYGNYLVDLYCLGIKNAYDNADVPAGRFYSEFMPKIFRASPQAEISAALAHEIVYGGLEYAAQYGFHPHRDFRRAQLVLDPPDAHPRSGEVTFGHNGKPFYVQGPYDHVEAILRQLRRAVGEGNYHYLMQIGGPPPDEWEDDLETDDEGA